MEAVEKTLTISLTDEDGTAKEFDLKVKILEDVTEEGEVESLAASTNETEGEEVAAVEEEEEEDEEEEEAAAAGAATSVSVWRPKWEVKASAEAVKSLMGKRRRKPQPDEAS